MAAKIATSIGLAFDIIGVFILWRYGLPEALIRGGFGYVDPIVESDPVEKARADQYNMWSRVALYLIVGGFFSSDRRCVASDGLMRWRWRYTNEFGKRVESRWHMSEETAKAYKDAEKIEGTEEIRTPLGSTGDFMKSQPKSEPERLLHPVGTLPIRSA